MKRLTAEQADHYWKQGYVLVRGLFDADEVRPWLEHVRALAARRTPAPPGMVLVKDVMFAKGAAEPETPEHLICKINFFENDPVLRGYAEHPRLLDCLEDLLGPDLLWVNSMCITKPPGVDGRHPLHQDLLYFGFRPGDAVCGTWTALEPVTRANGCLSVLPGSHRGGLHPHEMPDWDYVNAAFLGAKGFDPENAKGCDPAAERVHVEMEPGDVLLFHSLLVHGSGTNRTQGFRRAVSTHYAAAGTHDEWGGVDRIAQRPWIPVRTAGRPPTGGSGLSASVDPETPS